MPTTIFTDVDRAINMLRDGCVVAVPTEIIYGLVANAHDPQAVALIFRTRAAWQIML